MEGRGDGSGKVPGSVDVAISALAWSGDDDDDDVDAERLEIWFQTNSSSSTNSRPALHPHQHSLHGLGLPGRYERLRSILMHRLNQRPNIPPLRLRPRQPPLAPPRIPLILIRPRILSLSVPGARHDGFDITLHALFVETVELEAVGGGWARAADALDGVEGVGEDAVCVVVWIVVSGETA